MLHFVGAVALGVIGPLGTWTIVKGYPQTTRAAWVFLGITASIIAAPRTLLWFVVLLWA